MYRLANASEVLDIKHIHSFRIYGEVFCPNYFAKGVPDVNGMACEIHETDPDATFKPSIVLVSTTDTLSE